MSGLLFMRSDDFYVKQTQSEKLLCNKIRGISLILFYSFDCDYCKVITPVFKTLPGTIGNCQFGMINISQNKQTYLDAKNTNSPIEYVPYIVIYMNGVPFHRYEGPANRSQIQQFVIEAARMYNERNKFVNESKEKLKNEGNKIPAYCFGVPISGKKTDRPDVCYLNYDGAYLKVDNSKRPPQQQRQYQ